MVKKTVTFNKSGIESLPNNKSVTYVIERDSGKENYVGIAKRGRVSERIMEHLQGEKDAVPGSKVRIEQHSSIKEALAKEARMIMRIKPPYNKKGK